jgi:3'-5' exoribonuclease
MDKGKFIDQLAPGTTFSQSVFIAVNPEIKQGKAGNPYAMFNIEDRTGNAPAKFWNVTPEIEKILMSGSFFAMSGQVDNGQYAGQVTVSSIRPVAEIDLKMDDFLQPLPPDHQAHYDRFIALVKSVKNTHLKALLKTIFGNPPERLKQFRDAVAAKSMHHSHRGGLLEHSTEVALMCDKICEVVPDLNRDLLVTCALLHDIGKLEEMEHGLHHGTYTADGALIGHIVLGAQMIATAMGPDFPPILKKLVLHLILSHHRTGDFGSPKEPSTAEAHVLAACDEASAKACQIREAIKNARPGLINVKAGDGYVYVGEYNDDDELIAAAPLIVPQDSVFDFDADCARLRIAGTGEFRDVVLPTGGADYLLAVKNNSMDTSGILDGDLLFINKDLPRENHNFVAVVIDNTEQVRRLSTDNNNVEVLESDDPKVADVMLTKDVCVTGVITGLIREL